jgi:hypothetical protein
MQDTPACQWKKTANSNPATTRSLQIDLFMSWVERGRPLVNVIHEHRNQNLQFMNICLKTLATKFALSLKSCCFGHSSPVESLVLLPHLQSNAYWVSLLFPWVIALTIIQLITLVNRNLIRNHISITSNSLSVCSNPNNTLIYLKKYFQPKKIFLNIFFLHHTLRGLKTVHLPYLGKRLWRTLILLKIWMAINSG